MSTALQQLMDKCQLTAPQVNGVIQQKDVSYVAACFDNTKLYVDVMELTPGEQNDEANTHAAMIECLKIWKRKKLSQATFRVLLEMLVKLKKWEIATQVCQYLKVSVCSYSYIKLFNYHSLTVRLCVYLRPYYNYTHVHALTTGILLTSVKTLCLTVTMLCAYSRPLTHSLLPLCTGAVRRCM